MPAPSDTSSSSLPRVGFVGLGVMGTPMSTHLAAAGYPLTVFDIDTGASSALAAAEPGITVAPSLAHLAAASDIVFTMLPDGNVVREVVIGSDGLAAALAAGSMLIDTSS